MVYRVVIIVNEVSSDLLNALYAALKPDESLKIRGVNMIVSKSCCERKVIIALEAPTINSLRAVLNSTLKLSKLVFNSIENLKGLAV